MYSSYPCRLPRHASADHLPVFPFVRKIRTTVGTCFAKRRSIQTFNQVPSSPRGSRSGQHCGNGGEADEEERELHICDSLTGRVLGWKKVQILMGSWEEQTVFGCGFHRQYIKIS